MSRLLVLFFELAVDEVSKRVPGHDTISVYGFPATSITIKRWDIQFT